MKKINWGANFNLLYARYYSKYLVDGKEYNQTLNEFKYSNIINPNNNISIGNTCSSSVAFSIFKPEITLENKDITIFEGVKGNNGIKYVQIGIFTVTKEESNGEYTKYTAYDKMYKAEKGYFSELTYPNTDKAILEEICTKLGIQLATSITNTHTITDKPQGYTMREMIGYMAMLQGCNAVINADGNLELRWYKDSGYVLDGHKYYQQGVTFTTSKDFIIQKLTCNNTKSSDKETSTITSGSGATGLSFANPFMTQAVLDRQLLDCWIWQANEPFDKRSAWVDLLLTANHSDTKLLFNGEIITITRGQILTSVRQLSAKWNWSVNRTYRFLKMLENENMVQKESNDNRTLLTIVNYSVFQFSENSNGNTNEHANGNTDRTLTEAPTETVTEHIQECKECNNDKESKNDKSTEKDITSVISKKKSYYPDDELLDEAFNEYLTMRKRIKKPICTDKALHRAMNTLEKLSGGDNDLAVKILNQSVDHCWQGLFELKEDNSNKQGKKNVFDEWMEAMK